MNGRGSAVRALLAALLSLSVVGIACYAVIGIVLQPAPAPAVAPTPVAPRPLGEHVLLLIVDGLRHDVATDGRMPLFEAAMQEHSSAEIWAGKISMSSSAILAYGTGQGGGIEQLVFNMDPKPSSLNPWLANAARGQELAIVGDLTWVKLYGAHFAHVYPDPPGVAMEADLNAQNFADLRTLVAKEPAFIAAQFTTPDHQGHVWGIPSKQYAAHMRAFDGLLHDFLGELGPGWTVIVTSDHGADDSGAHGTDTELQRRCPIFAYGPGIRPGVKDTRRLEQPDLANTMAVLLGIPPPAHSFGHTMVEWLDYGPAEVAAVGCGEARRAATYGDAALGGGRFGARAAEICAPGQDPATVVEASRGFVHETFATVHVGGIGSPALFAWLAVAVLLSFALGVVVYGRQALRSAPHALALVVVAVLLTLYVERLPRGMNDVVPVILFVLVNLITVVAVIFPGRLNDWLDAHPRAAPIVLPGLLVASYTRNTQAMSFVAAATCTLYFVLSGHRARGGNLFQSARLAIAPGHLVLALACVGILLFPGIRPQNHWGEWVFTRVPSMVAVSCAAVVIWVAVRSHRHGFARERLPALSGLAVMLGALLGRTHATPELGRMLVAVLAISALVFALQRRLSLALYFGVACYALLLTREIQIVAVVATLVLAETAGEIVFRDRPAKLERPALIMLSLMIFGLVFVQRIAIQSGIDIGDFAPAATFGDSSPPWWAVTVGVTLRWLIPELLVVGLALWPALPTPRAALLRALTVIYTARVSILLLMIVFCGNSFWTAKRCLGDIPFAALAAVGVALTWLTLELLPRRATAESAEPTPASHTVVN